METEIAIQRYSSTSNFVYANKINKQAEECFGKGWESEDDVNQIEELLKFIGRNDLTVKLIEGLKEDDIEVYPKATDIENAKQVLRDNGYYVDSISHIVDVTSKFKATEEEAITILEEVCDSDKIGSELNEAIDEVAERLGLVEIEDEEKTLIVECKRCDSWEEQPADSPRQHIQEFEFVCNDDQRDENDSNGNAFYKCKCGNEVKSFIE